VCLHGKQRAIWRELRTVWNVHATEVAPSTNIVAVHDVAVGQNVGEGAFLAELAVSLTDCELPFELLCTFVPPL
jgi:hypothetical protein